MDERRRFLAELRRSDMSMAALCRAFGVSRKTGYKWLSRHERFGLVGLSDAPRAPRTNPRAVPTEIVELVIAARREHARWGPKKLLAWLSQRHPSVSLPAASTIGEILVRYRLVEPRKRRRHAPPHGQPFNECSAPNDTWCADFKGHFAVGDGSRCHPLTLADAHTRFLLRCSVVARPIGSEVIRVFEGAFREFGLPRALRTDNGPPFASVGAGGLSSLSVWLVKLGIVPERIPPGEPQQNGRLERLHRTLKAETTDPAAHTLLRQQRVFDRFRYVYNVERPHEALAQKTPGSVYRRSSRPFPRKLQSPEYPVATQVKRVDASGNVYWRGVVLYTTTALENEWIGFEEAGDGLWTARFGPVFLGTFDEARPQLGLIHPRRVPRRRRRPL